VGKRTPPSRPTAPAHPSRTTEVHVERGGELGAHRRVHMRPALILSLGPSIVALSRGEAGDGILDRSNIVLVPAAASYRLKKKSATIAVLTIEIGDGARGDACEDYAPHVTASEMTKLFASYALLPRTRWFDEIAQRYLFEREVCQKTMSRAARFLEPEIAKEAFFLAKEKSAELGRASVVSDHTELVRRALARIEEDIFRPCRVDELARECHASESTLLRAFKKEVGVAPATYQRDRRLDESLLLLRSKRFTVGEIALRVGYTNMGAFASAFRRRFGAPPSSLAEDDRALSLLPPHGMKPEPSRPARRRNRRQD